MRVLQLKEYQSLFQDEAAYREFQRRLVESLSEDEEQMLFCGEQMVGALMTPKAISRIMKQRILGRFASQPDLMDEMRKRVEANDLVE